MSGFVKVSAEEGFPMDRALSFNVDGQAVLVARHQGGFYAIDDQCTHSDSLLSPGELEGDEVSCPLHGARFSIKTGHALSLPAVRPVRAHQVKVENGDVYVKINPEPARLY